METVAIIFAIIGTVTLFGGLLVLLQANVRMPVRFKNLDEEDAVYEVACWAAQQLNIPQGDLRLRYSLFLWSYSARLNWMGSIPVEELALLSPFIDLMIEGKGPPRNLPAEYDDPRPAILVRFKSRMESQGLWPQSRPNRVG